MTTSAPPTNDLQRIPGVGPSISKDLIDLGIGRVADLRGQDPQQLFERLCLLRGEQIDRCVLYVFRCAVYFATTNSPEPERLKWWNWKDEKTPKKGKRKRRDER